MTNKETTLKNSVCLFCGNQKKKKWDGWLKYYECDCSSVMYNKMIDEKIRELELQINKIKNQKFRPKYEIREYVGMK